MSGQSHGGFLLKCVDGSIHKRVVTKVQEYLCRFKIPLEGSRIEYGAVKDSPVLRVSVLPSGIEPDSGNTWHYDHSELGQELATTLGCEVWTYFFEDRNSRWEAVAHHQPKARSATPFHEDEEGPLARLAAKLVVPKQMLSDVLCQSTVAILLHEPVDDQALVRFLSGQLNLMPEHPRGISKANPGEKLQSFFVPAAMLKEAESLSAQFSMTVDKVFWAAWECGKEALYERTAGFTADELEPSPSLPAPSVEYPPGFRPGTPNQNEPLSLEGGMVELTITLPTRVLDEIKRLALFADRSMSWCLQKSYIEGRDRLFSISD